MAKCWVYHPEHEPMIIDQNEADLYYKNGWFDTPAAFIKTTDFGIEPDDVIGVQVLGEAIEGIKDAANDALNLDHMNKDELEAFALKHFNKDLDKRWSKNRMIKEIERMLNGNGSGHS